MPEPRRLESALAELERAYGGLRAAFEVGASKSWSEDEWAGCAWAYADEGDLPALQQPEGGIHFAGEHTSRWPSWMQGALESGRRVAREIEIQPHAEPR
jgi:monoamine oxidase